MKTREKVPPFGRRGWWWCAVILMQPEWSFRKINSIICLPSQSKSHSLYHGLHKLTFFYLLNLNSQYSISCSIYCSLMGVFVFLEHTKHISTSGPLHLLFHLPRTLFLYISCFTRELYSLPPHLLWFSLNVVSGSLPSCTI